MSTMLAVPGPPTTVGDERATEPATARPGSRSTPTFGPNWFAAVMGTGIVANASATLPVTVPGLLPAAGAVWALDALLLLVVATATLRHHHRDRAGARYLRDPVLAHFYGAPAMALLTVGAGALLVGVPVVGEPTAVLIAAVLWTVGTVLGVVTSALVPYLAFTRHQNPVDSVAPGWLMPVVPPMVSAATGPLLLPYLPLGQWQLAMQLICAMLFGMALLASLVLITLLWGRLAHYGIGAAAAVPTLWIVLGPLGQSVTAAHTMAGTASGVLPAPYGPAFEAFGLLYGLPVWGFAMLWLAIAVAITVRTARVGLPFSLTWWSFTFPVGTVVTGTSALAVVTGAVFLEVTALGLYVALVAAWVTVAVRTLRGTRSGVLLRPLR